MNDLLYIAIMGALALCAVAILLIGREPPDDPWD